jgi:hypothetical protein
MLYAEEFWNKAVNFYNQGDKSQAYYNLGILLHLLEDMSSTSHVYNDAHLSPWLLWGQTNTYEEWVGEEAQRPSPQLQGGNTVSQPQGIVYGSSNLTYEDFIHELALKTYNDIAVYGNLVRSTACPATGDLGEMFVDSNNADLDYMRYAGSFVNEYWSIIGPDDEYYYSNVLASDSWWPIKDGKKYGIMRIKSAV